MWWCINNTTLCCMACLFQTSLACTARRQTESFSGWVLLDNLPGCSLEKIIRHTELEFVRSFYFIFSMHSVLVQQSPGWISTPIRIPYFQEFISCGWAEGEQDVTVWEQRSRDEVVLTKFWKAHKTRMTNACCIKQTVVLGGCQKVGTGDMALLHSEPLAICADTRLPVPHCPPALKHGQRKGPFVIQRASGLQRDTNAWTACLLWSLSWHMVYST